MLDYIKKNWKWYLISIGMLICFKIGGLVLMIIVAVILDLINRKYGIMKK